MGTICEQRRVEKMKPVPVDMSSIKDALGGVEVVKLPSVPAQIVQPKSTKARRKAAYVSPKSRQININESVLAKSLG